MKKTTTIGEDLQVQETPHSLSTTKAPMSSDANTLSTYLGHFGKRNVSGGQQHCGNHRDGLLRFPLKKEFATHLQGAY